MAQKSIFLYFLKLLLFSFLLIVVTIIFSYSNIASDIDESEICISDSKGIVVMLDPGHGGIDDGAYVSDTSEKELNLSVSESIEEYLKLFDISVIMTRDCDKSLADESASRKKISDLQNRVLLANTCKPDAFVSIHMNVFPIEKYKGLQTFYSPNNNESKNLADIIQENTISFLQQDNNRKVKRAGTNIFILDRLYCPSVLVECGFMSNKGELSNLKNKDYQNKLAFVITNSIIQFIISKD